MDGAPVIFDRTMLRLRQQRALATAAPGAAFLLERAADDLGDRIAAVLRTFDVALDLGTLQPHAAQALLGTGRVGAVLRAAPLAGAVTSDAGRGSSPKRRRCPSRPKASISRYRCSPCRA